MLQLLTFAPTVGSEAKLSYQRLPWDFIIKGQNFAFLAFGARLGSLMYLQAIAVRVRGQIQFRG